MGKYKLLEAVGLELEFAIVDKKTLDILPRADFLLKSDNKTVSEVNHPPLAWSNELVKHVIEIKNPHPVKNLTDIARDYILQVKQINRLLDTIGACLLPTGAHPWMNSLTQRVLWDQEQTDIYYAYDRIFSTQGHGWSNLQSAHLNISFSNSREFGILQTISRLFLPAIPGLTATTPYLDGKYTGLADARLKYYGENQQKIPSIAGAIIPEPVFTIGEYHRKILEPMYKDIAPYDPDVLLQEDWLNSRGAIPKFSRSSVEIRIIDLQAHPAYDLVIAMTLLWLMKHCTHALSGNEKLLWTVQSLDQASLVDSYQSSVQKGSLGNYGVVQDIHRVYPELFPFDPTSWSRGRVREFWVQVLTKAMDQGIFPDYILEDSKTFLKQYTSGGTWSEQTLEILGTEPSSTTLFNYYQEIVTKMPGY